MSEQLTLTLDNVSQRTSQIPAQITQHEIEGEHVCYTLTMFHISRVLRKCFCETHNETQNTPLYIIIFVQISCIDAVKK